MVSASAKTRVMKSSCVSSPSLHCGKNVVSLKNVFVEAEAELIVLNLNIFLFIIQCDERESSDKYQREAFVLRWSACVIVWVASWTSHFFFMENYYFLKEQLTGKPQCAMSQCLADICLKMNKVSLSLWGKQLTTFVASDKIRAFFQAKIRFQKICVCYCEIESVPTMKDFSDETLGGINKRDF